MTTFTVSKAYDAYFSRKQCDLIGYSIYAEVGTGRDVKCTCVVQEGNHHGTLWDDIVYVGKVYKWIASYPLRSFQNFSRAIP